MATFFLLPPLDCAELLACVAGHAPRARRVRLPGHRALWPRGLAAAVPVPAGNQDAEGIVIEALSATERERLAFWHRAQGLVPVALELEDGRAASGWGLREPPDETSLPLPADLVRAVAEEVMGLFGRADAAALRRRWPMLAARGASRWRARSTCVQGGESAADGVETIRRERPWDGFFAVETRRLRHRLFAGGMSAEVERAGFVMADAVTVLPYDPARDRVLVIEQFRFGPLLREDPAPWMLEPVAGRIDLGETPEETARREAMEEAGVELGALHPIGSYYPTPGAVSEYLWSFIGIAELPDGAAGIRGLASEHEDIRGRLVSFPELEAMLVAGQLRNGPMLLSALWLARHRARLRAGTSGA
ncbi:nudix-type nucleoside diphosphatase, YffH/AdpP family [Meinhardsimonia xiamenensis]|jgi:nudix-type nucleoside diphosphatase (YffH/AdpP family)|uniref:ADP-ribose pyrophosphatase n=1 Tax=Meinhardsimonia xiamenensis TaxID=990712 RepID=A0A1G9G263_9RHOB|nr:NUDIX domain-containing protein [Meinhardsimonia xiamenensis]PRX32711.1 nudix-type nucleoside diphosphatase (YffH/AdpP family) [Meinhardsimonia xiamenensis]SDK94750.1 nudix-type nucleoside diphosphatase, YffH/AdpP family [Meinhardsimonia xiamenensis]